MSRLIIEQPGAPPRLYELKDGSSIRIGRAASNDVTLPHNSISRSHACLEGQRDAWVITDMRSANGVLVNGERVERAELHSGDVIGLGDIRLRFENMTTGTVVAKASPELNSHLTQILDPKSVAKLLEQSRAKPASEWSDQRTDDRGRLEFLRRENRLLTLLYNVSRALGDKATVEEVTSCVLDLVLQIDGGERGYAMLLTEDQLLTSSNAHGNYSFLPAIIRYRRPPSANTPEMVLSRAIIQQVMESKGPLLVMDAKQDERFSASASMAASGMQSAMCAPLASRERLFGLLYVDNLSRRGTFTPDDLEVFAVIAAQAGLAIDRVLARSEVKRQGAQLGFLQRFVSPAVYRKIASDAETADIRFGGDSQHITVLFADVRGFTTMAEKMAPREAVEVLNEFFTRMTDVIFAHDGTLDKYLGDGIMALFGAPLALNNDAEAAVRAAADMQRGLEELNGSSGKPPLQIGIGIHSGEAIVGYLGTTSRTEYSAIGDTVNVASRLTSQAGPGQIVISAATRMRLGRDIGCNPLAPMKLKGRAEQIDVHEVLWHDSDTRA